MTSFCYCPTAPQTVQRMDKGSLIKCQPFLGPILRRSEEEAEAFPSDRKWQCTFSTTRNNLLYVRPYVVLYRFSGVKETSKGHALFPTFSLINHSCSSNCRYLPYWTDEGKIEMEVRVCSPVAKGDELTIQYTRSVLYIQFCKWSNWKNRKSNSEL